MFPSRGEKLPQTPFVDVAEMGKFPDNLSAEENTHSSLILDLPTGENITSGRVDRKFV